MADVYPPNLTPAQFDRALAEFESVVGGAWVLSSQADRDGYLDPFPPGDADTHAVSAAVAPAGVEEIQAILAIARRYKIPLWPISCGKNHGYGGAAPRLRGSVVLDLKRMNRIIDVSAEMAYAIVEPGVTFFQLFDYLEQHGIKLWLSTPAPGWGSVLGNALERGVGYTPYGDHASMQCGMEVVLANGEIIRTGMGAKAKGNTWPLSQYGFGPAWDKVFMQSNYGIVTKIGIWLMPEPEATAAVTITVPNESDLPRIVDTIRPLRIGQVINSNLTIANAIRRLAQSSTRTDWFTGDGPIPDELLADIMRRNQWNFWEISIPFFDTPEVVDARVRTVEQAFVGFPGVTFEARRWQRGEPIRNAARRVPGLAVYMVLNWRGGKGGHIGFAPICAPTGSEAMRVYELMKRRTHEFGFDFFGGFTFFQRHMIHTSLILFDANDAKMARAAHDLFATAVREASSEGFAEYRSHVSFMDLIADGYDFNDHALWRLNERVKDLLDPDGILAPGKQGIWGAAMREFRG